MNNPLIRVAAAALICALPLSPATAEQRYDQSSLVPLLNQGSKVLQFDWPTVQIGTGDYAEGPTGVTVIRFTKRSHAAVDVRGGGPGTVNTDYLRIGYDVPELDARVLRPGRRVPPDRRPARGLPREP